MYGTEEVTALTDYVLAALSLLFAVAIGRSIGAHNRVSAWLWCAAFIAAAVAGAAGGAFHGLALQSETARTPLWTLIIAAMGASAAFMTGAMQAAHVQRKKETVRWLVAGIAVTLVGAVVQRLQLPQSTPFDHNGVYHLIQIAGLYLFYRCARTVHDRPGIPLEFR